MKKHKYVLIFLLLLLAAMACNLPMRSQSEEPLAFSEPGDGFRQETLDGNGLRITIIVPDGFFLGQSGNELLGLLGGLDPSGVGLSGDGQNLLLGIEDNILLWGYDTRSSVGNPASFVVIKNQEFAAVPFGILETFAGTLLGNDVQIVDQARFNLGGRDTLRWITVTSVPTGQNTADVELVQAVYVFKQSGTLYLVGFNAERQEVYGMLPVYDSIVATLTIEDLN